MAEVTAPPAALVDAVYETLARTHITLDSLGLTHLIVAGTLLGAERHGGLIPHDDDGDVFVDAEELARVPPQRFAAALRAAGLESKQEEYRGMRFIKLRTAAAAGGAAAALGERGWCVDLFPFATDATGSAAPTGHSPQVGLPQLRMDARAIFPLRGYRFGPLELPGPRDVDAALAGFGPDWRTTMRVWNHKGGSQSEPTLVRIGASVPPALPSWANAGVSARAERATGGETKTPDAAAVVQRAFDDRHKWGSESHGPSLPAANPAVPTASRIAILTLYDDPIADYADWANACVQLYAHSWGHDLITIRSRVSSRSPEWDKVRALALLLDIDDVRRRYDFVLWIDADAAFQLPDVALSDVLGRGFEPATEILISDDAPNRLEHDRAPGINPNTGVFAVRTSQWTRDFLALWWNSPMGLEHRKFHEQGVLAELLRRDAMGARSHVRVAPAETLNSIFAFLPNADHPQQDRPTFVLHMMQQRKSDRVAVFRALYERLKREL